MSTDAQYDFQQIWVRRISKDSMSDENRKQIAGWIRREMNLGLTDVDINGTYGECCAAADWLGNPPHNLQCDVEKIPDHELDDIMSNNTRNAVSRDCPPTHCLTVTWHTT